MKNLKAKQKAKGVKELSDKETEEVTGGLGGCWEPNPFDQPAPTRDPFPGIVTYGKNEDGRTPPFGG